MYNPTPDSLNVRWEPASGQVQQYRVAYSALSGAARPKSVSGINPELKAAERFTENGAVECY